MNKFIINNIKFVGGVVKFPIKKFFTSKCTAITKMALFGSVKEISAMSGLFVTVVGLGSILDRYLK